MEEKMEPKEPEEEVKSDKMNYWAIGAVALIVVVGIIWYAGARKKGGLYGTPANAPAQSSGQTDQPASEAQKQTAVIVEYTDSGFSPQSATIKAGEAVEFINKNSGDMFVASAPHPLHDGYDGTLMSQHCAPGATPSFDSCKAVPSGGSYSFTFGKVGTWKYHNHLDPTKFGSIVVQ